MGNTDSIPVISQIKSFTQVLSGDVEGARKTQENFRDTAPVVSQVTSLVHVMGGNADKARDTQKKFVKSVDELTDGLPVVGHIKGGVYYAVGDDERGEKVMKSATGSAVSMAAGAAGFAVGGPIGAAAGAALGSHAYDGIVTGIDTAIHGTDEDGSPRYYGSLATYDRMSRGEADAGEIFDTVGMTAIDAATAALGVKFAKSRLGKGTRRSGYPRRGFKGTIRCRRDVEYQLTPSEAEFVTNHQRLPGSVSEVMTANWQHLSIPQTVSNLVSLFIILRLILWNDKNGRNYSRELCTLTSETEYIDRCQDALRKTLREMEDHLASQRENQSYILDPDFDYLPGITNNSTIVMIRVMSTLYGILGSMGSGQTMGVKWLMELCIYEDLSNYRICEEEVIHKLQGLQQKASYLGQVRKLRVKRGGKRCGIPSTSSATGRTLKRPKTGSAYDTPKLNTNDFDSIRASDVGTHANVRKTNQGKRGKFESNHVPASSSYGKPKPPIDPLPAHSLPYDVHQFAMRKVGTSKSGTVARTLRGYESDLISKGRMAEAVKLDLTASYGRSNVLLDTSGNTKSFRPALVEYRKDLHALINEHRHQNRISRPEAANLHRYLEDQVSYWGKQKPSWDKWFDRMESNYKDIVNQNGLNVQDGIKVPSENRQYG